LEPGTNRVLVRSAQGWRGWSFSVALPGDRTGPLFEHAPPPPPPPEVEEYRAFAMANAGDPSRGYALFRDEHRLACIRCHAFASGRGRLGDRVGPDLDGITARASRADLITSLLEPSRHLADGYRATEIRTVDGDLLFGQVTHEDARRVVLVRPDGERREVPARDIADRRQSALSVMPEGLHELISPEELSDLLAFLETLAGGGSESTEGDRR
jgi:putative heme-binding domain-containing protein